MKKLLLLIATVLLTSAFASAQTMQIYTGTIKDLSGTLVTSGQVTFTFTPSIDSTISGIGRFTPTTTTCKINGDGTLSGLVGGVSSGPCQVVPNISLSPGGTSYRICEQPYFSTPGQCFFDSALGGTKDISSIAPALTTGPFNYSGIPGPPLDFIGPWSSTVTYNKGQVVSFSNAVYISLTQPNRNNNPSTSTANWSAIYTPPVQGLINVSTFSGADICAKINAAALANPGLVLDARQFTGNQACARNPFAGTTGDIVLYLGEVHIQTTAPWVTNSQFGALIYGAGRGTLSTVNPHGTTIQAVPGFPATCAGLASACPVVRLGDFSAGTGGAFGHRFENLSVDCNNQPGSIGFYSNDIQEQSGLIHFQALNCPVNGVLMDGSFGNGKGAANYALSDGEIYSFRASTTSTVQVKIIGSAASHAAMRVLENITVASSTSVHAAAGFQFVSTFTGAGIGLNSEQNTTGYDIGPGGGGNAVDGLTLTSLTCGANTATCVWIHPGSMDVNAFTINNGSGNITLKDDTAIPSGNTITDSILSYMTADSGGIRWNTSHFPANSGNGMAATSLYLTSTNGQSTPAVFRQATDHPFTMTLDSGLTMPQGQAIAFLDRGVGKWLIQQTGSGGIHTNAFQLLDEVANIPRLFMSSTAFNTGYTLVQSAGSAPVFINDSAGSGTGGLLVCSGGSTITCPTSISGTGVLSTIMLSPNATTTPTGSCAAFTNGTLALGQDGHAASCVSGTWTSRW